MKKIFILGIGAQKAGTTVFHSVLENEKKVNFGPLKEYHIFDQNYTIKGFFNSRIKRYFLRFILKKVSFLYPIYFHLIGLRHSIVGDITPAYCILSEKKIKSIYQLLGNFFFDVRIVFILRDPVARVHSAVKMWRRNNNLNNHGLDKKNSDDELVLKSYKFYYVEEKTRYEKIIPKINFIPNSKKIILFNENLNEKVSDINLFFKLNLDLKVFNKRHGPSSSKVKMPLDVKVFEELVEYYKETYFYCFKNYPETKRLWEKAYIFLQKKYSI